MPKDSTSVATGRYHLYAAKSCPWSHRALVVRALRGLEDAVSVAYLHPFRDDDGWALPGEAYADPVNGFGFLSEAYRAGAPGYDGRISSPVLWDRETNEVVSNQSGEIIRMFNDLPAKLEIDLYPEPLRAEVDELNAWLQESLNEAVYTAGWAASQQEYAAAYRSVFETLDDLDRRLGDRRYLCGGRIAESDVRLFTTLVRFDTVYHQLYRCNAARLVDYPNLWGYARDLYQQPGVAGTVSQDEIKVHYYTTQLHLNPQGIIPLGPRDLDFGARHARDRLSESREAWEGGC
ncbi:MAG TPA: glutathione S-transferase C-terminal domain-containing protein [Baekduia sp.]|nr:glutathione S-transferase C-terminal domain-containing protein [Baekduia sp.]